MSEGADSRFAHLLQPIKDLTKNWDVDIASSLEDYLEELEGTAISFDDGVTTMNFAEAAMLIQSSACVYSKKVEYLYSLVQEMLDLLANKKKLAKKKQEGNTGDETAAEFADNDDEEFLTLDDIEEGHDIDMKGDFDNDEPFHFLPQIPLSLIPKEEADLGSNPLLSETGEVLASRNDFMMNTCSVDGPTGALLLDLSHLAMLQELPKPPAAVQETLQNDPISLATAEARVSEVSEDPEVLNVPEHLDDPDDADVEMLPKDISMQDQPMEQPADAAPDNASDVTLRRSERRKQNEVAAAAPKQMFDPWKLLDMYEEQDTHKQPPKKGVVYKLPPGLEDKTRKRKRPNTKAAPALEPLNIYISKAFYSNVKKYPKNPLKVPTDPVCDTLFWKEYKRRREIMRKESEKKRHHSIISSEAAAEEREEEDNWDIHGDAEIDDDDDIQPLVDDNLMNAINEGLRSNEEFVRGMPERDLADKVENSVIIDSYEDMVRQHVEQYMAEALNSVQTTELSCRVAEWQDKVVPSLKEEETREPFDINTYGNRVIDRLELGRCVNFERVVSGKPGFEVCRTFLAMLMLANTQNVEIKSTSEGLAVSGTDFGVQLLSTRRHFEELQDFQAPSINGTAEKS